MGSATWICPYGPPDYYMKTLQLIGLFSLPINFLCFYFVWFYTPKESKFRYCLAYFQFIAFLVEVDMSLVCPGFYLFPLMGGYNLAETNRLFSGHQTVVFGYFKFSFELPSLLLCFIYRHNAAANFNPKFKIRRSIQYLVIATCHTFPFVTAICLLKSELSHVQQVRILEKNWPNCLHILDHRGFVMYDPFDNPWTTAVGLSAMVYISVFTLFGAYVGFHTVYILQKVKPHLSPQTYAGHKNAMINLVMQCVVPIVCVITPFNLIFLVVYYDLWQYQQSATNLFFLMSAQSMATSLVIILSNRRFKRLILEKLLIIPYKIAETFTPPSLHVYQSSTRVAPS
ncbi:Serpentine Receptor, class T [Caenorhabditis elegans]|uniref:Serpentine Receptor, class T n=1 Tax=Caenorhabditis elegans TaxID=6239 RepID=Q7YZP5_CAEEL|nr:Serpentine Receptor, class T [Caenorhabditis elegans]CAE11300.1 Serpentine Receptor, class T [Caenorhabditis elegans]|eukprot:NP_001021424.1 Serpentine Receptor, class I [Caenorhabditis elegans]